MSRFPIPAPRSDEGTLVPAILSALLAAMIPLQLYLTRTDEPVSAGRPLSVLARYAPPRIVSVAIEPAILEQPIFSPARTRGGDGANPDLLDGAQVAGAWSVGRQTRLVLRKPDGRSVTMRIGDVYKGWQFAAITTEGARFARSGDTKVIPFGASAPRSRPKDEAEADEADEE